MLKTVIGAFCSFIIPGLGQLFHGKWLFGFFWFFLACFFGPVINVVSAAHVFFIK